MVKMGALAGLHHQTRSLSLAIPSDVEGQAGFYTAQKQDRSLLNLLLGHHGLNQCFLALLRTGQIKLRSPQLLKFLVRQVLNSLAESLSKALEILYQHFAVV
jgi:hypothetical protein